MIVHRDFEPDGKSLARIMVAKVKNKYIGKVNKQGIPFEYDTFTQSYSEVKSFEGVQW